MHVEFPHRFLTVLCALAVLSARPGHCARPAGGEPRIDTAGVHRLYMDGDFDAAIRILEADLQETRPYRHEDSVFIYKHLGVMYTAQYETREKGKEYMHRLLQVEPTARILDMYASDMIYMIFKNIQEEYEQNRMQLARMLRDTVRHHPEQGADGGPKDLEREPAAKTGSGKTWLWTGAAVAAVAAGIGVYILTQDDGDPGPRTHEVTP